MSTWVTPAAAADMWGKSLEDVLSGIADGSIITKMRGQLLVVDVDAGLELRCHAKSTGMEDMGAPADSTAVTTAELQALNSVPPNWSAAPLNLPELDQVYGAEEETRVDVSQWRAARQETGRLRRPPPSGRAS